MENTTFRYTEDDIVASNRCYAAHYWRKKHVRLAMAIVLLGLSTFCFSMAAGRSDPIWVPMLSGLALGAVMIILMYCASRWQVDRYARKNFAEQRNLADEFHFSWTEQGFEATSEHGSSRLAWADLLRWDEADTVLMLYLAERLYLAVPKRALSPEQLDSLRGHLSHALPDGRRKA